MKYPIGIQDFENIIKDDYVYVDKTALIYRLVTEGKIYFLSRPRRFGKSLLVSTLEAYFQGRKDLFKGLAIDELEEEWAKYPVFHLSFGGENFLTPGALDTKLENIIGAWEAEYGTDPNYTTLGNRFQYVLKAAHQKYGRRAVVLIDEYDKPLLDVLDTGMKTSDGRNELLLEEHNRNVLKGFYSVFKEADRNLQFVLLTGVTKFSQVSVFSGFNQPADISLDGRYEALCGITTEELHSYFKEPIKTLAQKYKYTEEEMKDFLKKQYDGYHFGENLIDIYNPFSVLNAFSSQKVDDYWFRSGTPSYLVRLLNHTQENLNELTNRFYTTQQFIDYKADVEMPLPMIYQSGYLT
ncbi:MAG: AAA family ATPase, partial [Bacteroidaceae bacterium]|nr:AAA family ATPase [Bacteroidaceae bacterium]